MTTTLGPWYVDGVMSLNSEADVVKLKIGLLPDRPYLEGVYPIGDRYVWVLSMPRYSQMRQELMDAPMKDLAMDESQAIRAEERYIRGATGVRQGRIEVVVSSFAVRTYEECIKMSHMIHRAKYGTYVLDKLSNTLRPLDIGEDWLHTPEGELDEYNEPETA